MTTDTSERGLESLIVAAMTGRTDVLVPDARRDRDAGRRTAAGWLLGDPNDYDREYCVDLVQLCGVPAATQTRSCTRRSTSTTDGPTRRKFLARLQGEITKRGVIDVLRHGVKHGPQHLDLFYGTPSPGNAKADERYAPNRFSVTRQLRYSRDETQLALDLGAVHQRPAGRHLRAEEQPDQADRRGRVEQYKRDRDPREQLFEFGRCIVHFAVDEHEVRFCTHLKGKALVVPAVQPGLERRRRQPAEPGRAQDRLPVEADPHPRRA